MLYDNYYYGYCVVFSNGISTIAILRPRRLMGASEQQLAASIHSSSSNDRNCRAKGIESRSNHKLKQNSERTSAEQANIVPV